MNYTLEIQKLLVKKDSLRSPDDKMKILKEAIALADANNDIDWGYDLRMDLMDEEYNTGRFIERFPAFAWLLETHDANPELFEEEDLLWRYRWMVNASRMNTNISAEQIENICNDFKIRLERNGYNLRAFYDDEFRRYYVQNSMDKAKQFLDLRENEKYNDMVCHACELTDKIDYELRLGNIDEALVIYNELIAKKYSCMRKPFDTFCSFVEYYTKQGELEKANEMFLLAEAKLSELNDTVPVGSISTLINFLAHYNQTKAWDFFQQYVHWGVDMLDEVEFKLAKNLLYLLSQGGVRNLKVSSKLPWYNADGTYNINELYNYYYNKAADLAQRFDARNGTPYFTQQLNDTITHINKK